MGSSRRGRKKPRPASRPAASEGQVRTEAPKSARRQRAIESRETRRKERLLVGAILLITFLGFANSLNGEFVYDDRLQVLKNPTIKSLSNIPRMLTESVWQFMNQGAAGPVGPYYRPLFNVALIINYQLFEFNVFGWHLVSVLFHLAVTLLVYLLARRFGLSFQVAAIAAFVFGIHPVHSESVAWVSGIPDPMAAVFILTSILVYERYREAPGRWRRLGVSTALALMAMLSKETSMALPVFLAVREALDRQAGETLANVGSRIAKRTAPFFAVTALYLVLRYLVLGFLRQDEPNSAGIPFTHVLLTIPSVLLSYARMLFVPYPLAVVYDRTYVQSVADPWFWLAGLGVVLILGAAVWLVRSSPVGRRALALLILFLLPVLNLKAFRPEESLLHDRYLYLPSIGFSLLVAMALMWIADRWRDRLWSAPLAAVIVIGVVVFGLTVNQNRTWQSETAMAGHALELYPHWPFLHNYLGANYSLSGRWSEAEQEYLEAIKYRANYYDAYSNLGDACREQGKLADAEQAYLKSIEDGAPYADTRYNLGVTYTSMNRLPEAEQALGSALEIQPNLVKARYNLGWVYGRQNKDAEAEQAYLKTLEYDSTYSEPRINLAVILTKQGRYKEAIDHLLTAQRYAPDNPVMLYALGDAYRQSNRYTEAIGVFNQLKVRQPQHTLVYTSLGLCYEAAGNKEQAKVSFQKAIEVAPTEQWTDRAREHLAKLGE